MICDSRRTWTGKRPVLVVFGLLLSSCAGPPPPPESSGPGLPADLSQTIDSFYQAIENDSHEVTIGLFSDGAIMMPNHGDRIEGKDAIAAVIRAGEGWAFRLRDRRILDADSDGGVAYTVNAYDYTYHAEGDEPVWHPTKNVHIWKRDPDGAWKLHVDIWNADGE